MFAIEVIDAEVKSNLRSLADRIDDMRPVMQAIGEDIMERSKQRFANSSGPDGKRWQQNAIATIEAYVASKGGFGKKGINKKGVALATSKKPLIGHSRDLSRQFHVQADGQSVTVGNSMIYAAIQQFGGKAGRGSRVTIPARPFLPVSAAGDLYPAEKAMILETINRYLSGK